MSALKVKSGGFPRKIDGSWKVVHQHVSARISKVRVDAEAVKCSALRRERSVTEPR